MKFDFEHKWTVYRGAILSLLGDNSLLGQNMSLFWIGFYLWHRFALLLCDGFAFLCLENHLEVNHKN